MNKMDLVALVAKRTGLNQSYIKAVVEELFDCISAALVEDEAVSIVNFGRFSPVTVEERTRFCALTQEDLTTPKHRRVKFTPSVNLKSLVYDPIEVDD